MDRLLREIKELGATLIVFIPIYLVFTTFVYELRTIPSESMVPTLQVGDRVAVSKFAYGYTRHSIPFSMGRFLPVDDFRFFGRDPDRGDVIVFEHPHTDRVMIKRLIGIPGDEVQMRGGIYYVNGQPNPQSEPVRVTYREYRDADGRPDMLTAAERVETNPDGVRYMVHDIVAEDGRPTSPPGTSETFIVPEGYLFFSGDNRDNSKDSRDPSGHCPRVNGVISEAGCDVRDPANAGSGFVPMDHLIGRADTVLFTLNFCRRYQDGCPKGRVWSGLSQSD